MCLRRVFISTCSAMARARLAEGPREHCGKCGGRARQPGGNSQGICGSCLQHSLAAAATHRPAQALAASPLAMAAPIRRKAPREHRGKCSGRARQPRGPLTGCLWDVPPASACRGSRTPPRSGAFRLLPCQAPSARDRKMIRNDPAPKFVQTALHSLIQTRRGDLLTLAAASSMRHPR